MTAAAFVVEVPAVRIEPQIHIENGIERRVYVVLRAGEQIATTPHADIAAALVRGLRPESAFAQAYDMLILRRIAQTLPEALADPARVARMAAFLKPEALIFAAIDKLTATEDEKAELRFADWGDYEITDHNAESAVIDRLADLRAEHAENDARPACDDCAERNNASRCRCNQ